MADADATLKQAAARPSRRRAPRATIAQVNAIAAAEGDRFGRFVVLEKLGTGGMGVVVAAYDPDLDRRVAIKVLRPDGVLANEDLRAQMVREAQALGRLSHPNVVAVYEVGTVERVFYLVMELVDGGTLKDWTQTERPWGETLRVLADAGRGLAAAHAHGLVHRDFKPQNVLVGSDGRVRVADFGVVGVAGRDDGFSVGTPAYMAPEQHTSGAVDARADQFAFCVTLWEALYGTLPFTGATIDEIGLAICAGPPPQPTGTNVPSRVHAVLERGLASAPEARFGSMTELLAALAHDPRRRARRVAIGGLVAALAVTTVVGWTRGEDAPVVTDACDASKATLAGTWDIPVQTAMRSSLVVARPDLGNETYERVEARLDAYATTWQTERASVCQLPGGASSPRVTSALGCLDRRRAQLRALTGVLARANEPAIVENAIAAAASLPPVRGCAETQSTAPQVRTTEKSEEAKRVDDAEALRAAGRAEAASVILHAVLGGSISPALEARAQFVLGKTRRDLADGKGAAEALRRAALLASSVGFDDLVARSYTELATVVAYLEGKPADTLAMQPFIEAAVVRAGGSPELRAAAEYAFGVAYTELGNYDDALVHLVRARDLWEHELDPTHPEAARVLLTYANVRSYKGDVDAAVLLWRDVIRLRETNLGPNHPALAGVLANLGRELADRGDADEAARLCERGLAIAEASGSPAVTRGHLERCLGAAHRVRGDHVAARDAFRRAVELTEGTANEYVAYVLTDLGTSELEAGDATTAGTHCERAVTMMGAHPDAALSVGCRGRVRLASGDPGAALPDLESALTTYEARAAPQTRGELRYALAQALAALNQDVDRQRSLARQAHDDFISVKATARAETVAQWIAARP